MPKRKQAALRFKEEKRFERATANKLIWDARLTHYQLLMIHAKEIEARVLKAREGNPNAYPDFRNQVHTLSMDLLRMIGFIGSGVGSRDTREKIEKVAQNLAKDDPSVTIRQARLTSLLLTILSLANKKCVGLAIPDELLFEMMKVAGVAMDVTDAFERGDLQV